MARTDTGAIGLLLIVWIVTWIPRFEGPIDLRWDAAVYYVLGTSLAEGKGYRLLNEPGEILGNQYPPGLPAIVAVHQMALGTFDPVVVGTALRRFYFVISGLYILSVYLLLRRPFGPLRALAGALICALSMNFVWLSDRVYSDVPFLLASTAFMLLASQRSWGGQISAGAAAAVAFCIRTLGAALLVAWVVDAAVGRHWKQLTARLLFAGALIGGWQGYVAMVEGTPEYQAPAYAYQRAPYLLYNVSYATNASLKVPFEPEHGFLPSGLARRFVDNVLSFPGTTGEIMSTTAMNWSEMLHSLRPVPIAGLFARWTMIRAGLILLGLITLLGLWYQWRNGQIREPVFVVTYLMALCAMNFTQELGRYLTGIQPFLVMALLTVLVSGGRRWPNTRIRHVFAGVLAATILVVEVVTVRKAYADAFPKVTHPQWRGHDVRYRLFTYSDAFRSFDAGIDWVTLHASPGEIVASSQPHWVFLRSGRQAVMPPFERDPERQQTLLDSVPVAYVIVDDIGFSSTREYSLAALQNTALWELVFSAGGETAQVYRRRADRLGPASER